MKKEDKYFLFDRPKEYTWKYIVKCVLYPLVSMFYRAILFIAGVKPVDKKYRVSVCAIFKNEAPYLREWIEFHKLVGVEHFYMYNNNSEDDYLTILQSYIDIGLVTLIQWPYNQQQMQCYHDCIEKFAKETKWLGFIDLDEFVVPKESHNVYDVLRKFENWPSVVLYWQFYCSSGRISRDINGLVTEDFFTCLPKHVDIGKCFYNTSFGFNKLCRENGGLHHLFWGNWRGINIPPINVFGKLCFYGINIATKEDFPIQINHYFTKSYDEYRVKKSKGDVYFKLNPHDDEYFFKSDMHCTSVDYSAYKYLVKLKLVMGIGK